MFYEKTSEVDISKPQVKKKVNWTPKRECYWNTGLWNLSRLKRKGKEMNGKNVDTIGGVVCSPRSVAVGTVNNEKERTLYSEKWMLEFLISERMYSPMSFLCYCILHVILHVLYVLLYFSLMFYSSSSSFVLETVVLYFSETAEKHLSEFYYFRRIPSVRQHFLPLLLFTVGINMHWFTAQIWCTDA